MSPPTDAGYEAQITAGVTEALADDPAETAAQEAPPPLEEVAAEEAPIEEVAEEAPVETAAEEVVEEAAPPTDAQAYIEAISKPLNEDGTGGIGHVPTPAELVQYYKAYVDQELFRDDLEYGDPNGRLVKSILESPNAPNIISKIPAMLERANPRLYRYFSLPILDAASNVLWEEMKAAPKGVKQADGTTLGGEFRQSLYEASQQLHHKVHNKYRPVAGAEQTDAAPSDRERALEARERKLNERLRGEQELADRAWLGHVVSMNMQALDVEIDRALGPAKSSLSPVVYAGLKDQYTRYVKSRIQANTEGRKLLMSNIDRASRSNDPASLESVREHYLRLARPEISSTRSEFLKQAGITIKANSASRHAQLSSSAQQKSPNGAPAPVRKSVQAPPVKGPISDSDYAKLIESTLTQSLV